MSPGSCVSFRGVQHKCCETGVDWAAEFGTFRVAPCIQFMPRKLDGKGTRIKPGEPYDKVSVNKREPHEIKNCVWFRLPTEAEMLADYEATEESLQRMIVGLKVAAEWRVKKPTVDRFDIVTCPICQGNLRLSQSSYNGHVHGQCETAGCLDWME